jgi:4-amino-4-deoxy-L-arabinose transferase-like glycosyltransferase
VGRLRANAVYLLFAAALALRLLVVLLEPPTRPLGDEPAWLAVADTVEAAGFDPFRADLIFYPPVYPYLIAATRRILGSLRAVEVLQALVGALLVPVVARLGRASFGDGVGLLAASFVALSPVLAWYAAHFWAEPVFVLLLWLGIERVMAGEATDRLAPIATGGLAIGLAALTREPALYALPLVAAWVALGGKKRSLLQAGLLLAAALLTVAPWTARNYARYSAFVPVSTMGGRALIEGNTDRTRGEVYAEYDEVGAEQGPIAQHRFAMQEGLRAIAARQPAWLFEKLAQEVPHLLSADNMVLVHVRRRGYGRPTTLGIWLVALATILPYLAVMGLFVLGLARLRWTRTAVLLVGFLLFYTALHVVVHGHHRFRLPMLPAIFVIAASAVPAAGAVLAPLTPRRRALLAALALLLVAVLVPGFVGFAAEPAFFGRPAR